MCSRAAQLCRLYTNRSTRMRHDEKTDKEGVIRDGDSHAETINGHGYTVLLI
jgi:hypothetical protein